MISENYYEREDNHYDTVNVQEQALRLACKKCGLAEYVAKFDTSDPLSNSDRLAHKFWYQGMYVKRACFKCGNLDMTFFYDSDGKASYTYAGFSDDSDTLENMKYAFTRAEQLRIAMDEAMEQLLKTLNERTDEWYEYKEIKRNSFVTQKYSDTQFKFGEIRSRVNMKTGATQYISCVMHVNLKKYSDIDLEGFACTYFDGGIEEIRKTYKENTNQILAQCIFKSADMNDMEFTSDLHDTRSDAHNTRSDAELMLWQYWDEKEKRWKYHSNTEWTEDNKMCMIQKVSDTCFYYGAVRTEFDESSLSNRHIFCTKRIDINDYSEDELEIFAKSFFRQGIREIKYTFPEAVNQFLASCVFRSLKTHDMDYISDNFKSENEAIKGLMRYAEMYLNEQKEQ